MPVRVYRSAIFEDASVDDLTSRIEVWEQLGKNKIVGPGGEKFVSNDTRGSSDGGRECGI